MISIFESLLPIFLVVGLGVFLKQRQFIADSAWAGIEKLAYWIMFPALLADTMIRADLSGGAASALAIALIVSVLVFALLIWLTRRPIQRLLEHARSSLNRENAPHSLIFEHNLIRKVCNFSQNML